MYLVVDEKSTFREDNFQKAMGSLAARNGEDPADPSSGQGRRGKTRKGKPQGEPGTVLKNDNWRVAHANVPPQAKLPISTSWSR